MPSILLLILLFIIKYSYAFSYWLKILCSENSLLSKNSVLVLSLYLATFIEYGHWSDNNNPKFVYLLSEFINPKFFFSTFPKEIFFFLNNWFANVNVKSWLILIFFSKDIPEDSIIISLIVSFVACCTVAPNLTKTPSIVIPFDFI